MAFNRMKNWGTVFAWAVLLAATLGSRPVTAQTYVSAEPIPSQDIVGSANLAKILNIGYPNLKLWSERLLCDCQIVQNVIYALSENGAISTVTPGNTRYVVAAGGFEGVTDPSYVFTIDDSGPGRARAGDIYVLDNAVGYVLNQGGTAQFSIPFNPNNPYEFSIEYAVVTFAGALKGERAAGFFDYLGTIDPALWTGTDAGFTQISFDGSARNNSMLFLIGAVSTREFTKGIFEATSTTPNTTYFPLRNDGKPTTAIAGVAFPGNDWIADPDGTGYLVNLGNPSLNLLNDLAALRQKHLEAVANLLEAIDKGDVKHYLDDQFKCP